MASTAVISYVRVSTSQQGRSGLGIEAQRQSLSQFAKAEGLELVREFVKVETGKGFDALDRRPQLKAALATAKRLKCPVAVAKLDRLSRHVHFISGLPIIKEAQRVGAVTLRAVAEALNARGISTARGGSWHAMSVKNVLDRPIAHAVTQQGER